jgi:anti-sigma factor RsiW
MRHRENHVADRLQALVDGELSREEERTVRDHCRECERCASLLRDAEEVYRRLGDLPPARLEESLWPAVQGHVHGRAAGRNIPLAVGASAMAAAGILIGLWIGPAFAPRSATESETTWAEMGSLLDDGTVPTLDTVYLGLDSEEESQ